MRKLLIGIVAVIVLIVLGAKLYVWHKTTKLADNLIALAAPIATISYAGTTSNLWSGQAGLTDISIHPAGMDSTVQIAVLTVEAGDLPGLFSIIGTAGEGRSPDALRLNLQHMQFDVDSALFQSALHTPGFWGLFGESFDTLACGTRDGFSAADLRRMGIRDIEFDLHIGYTLDRAAKRITMQVSGLNYELNAMDLTLSAQLAQGTELTQMLAAKPQLTGAHLHISDRGWNARWREFCAAESRQSEDAFLAAHATAVRAAFTRRGIGVSDGMLQHYRELLANNAELDITLRLAQPLNLDNLRFYAPDDLLYYLNPVVTVNATPVPIEVESLDAKTVARAQARQKETAKASSGYRSVTLGELPQYKGTQVRLTTNNGRVFEGKLARIDDRVARLQRPSLSGDTYEVLVLLWEVREIEVATP